MPKKFKPRKSNARVETASQTKPKRWVKYVALTIVLTLVLGVLAGLMSSTPANAGTSAPIITCAPRDTDGDGIFNNQDSDIDGDGQGNGYDDDIDGDGIPNTEDSNPASTNCTDDGPVPIKTSPNSGTTAINAVAIGLIIAIAIGYYLLRERRNQIKKSGKVKP